MHYTKQYMSYVRKYETMTNYQKNGIRSSWYRYIRKVTNLIVIKILLIQLQPFADECIGKYQFGFQKRKSTIDQMPVISQIIEKKFEYKQNVWQVFVDFKKAYDNIHREMHEWYKI
jgi:hypothetical protein